MMDRLNPHVSYAVVHIQDMKIAVPNMSQAKADLIAKSINDSILHIVEAISKEQL